MALSRSTGMGECVPLGDGMAGALPQWWFSLLASPPMIVPFNFFLLEYQKKKNQTKWNQTT